MQALNGWSVPPLLLDPVPVAPSFKMVRGSGTHSLPPALVVEELERIASFDLLSKLAHAAEAHDPYIASHLENIALYATGLASALGCDDAYVRELQLASILHDVGKLGVPQTLLRKRSALEDEERAVVRRHAIIGHDLLVHPGLEMARDVARCHHERWDGNGYPDGREGAAIPLSARIVAIADVFDALTSERSYKMAWPVERAIEHIEAVAGSHFDPTVAHAFIQVVRCGVFAF
jgi:putative two-component system response regulator